MDLVFVLKSVKSVLGCALYICLVCFKPMAPLYYQDTTYLVKLWYLKEKTRLISSIFYFKDISAEKYIVFTKVI